MSDIGLFDESEIGLILISLISLSRSGIFSLIEVAEVFFDLADELFLLLCRENGDVF